MNTKMCLKEIIVSKSQKIFRKESKYIAGNICSTQQTDKYDLF